MMIDTRCVDNGTVINATVCIIGGGVAGITLALELAQQGIDSCLLESGGLAPDNGTRDLYRGAATGLPYEFADGCRSRYLGGSSNCWGGWCRPLDPWDFEKRDWIKHSGWPFGAAEMAPYYARTHGLLKLGPANFDPAFWETAIGRRDVRRLALVGGKVRDTVSQFSPPARFGKLYREQLQRSTLIRVFLYANAVNIETDCLARQVSRVRVATLSGRAISVAARQFVLCAGGIENARLLLCSNTVQAAGLGNQHDLVGRYFMDHPRLMSGEVRLKREWARNKLYDIKYHYHNATVSAHGVGIAAQFALRPEVLAQERLLNARVWFCSIFHGEGSAGALALYRCKQAALKKEQPGWSLGRDIAIMLGEPVNTFVYGFTRLFQPRSLIKGVKFQTIVEPLPDPESRVRLSSTQVDRLGLPRVEISWCLGEQVKRTFDRTLAILAADLRVSGVAEVILDPALEGHDWPDTLAREGTWHHMGTTRMHDSARQGVVDRNGLVHGMVNLYVAGSSVFPTSGANFPTITIAALVLRLSDHLAGVLEAHHGGALPVSDEVMAANRSGGAARESASALVAQMVPPRSGGATDMTAG